MIQSIKNIDYTEDDEFWTFSVSDNGPGIEKKIQKAEAGSIPWSHNFLGIDWCPPA